MTVSPGRKYAEIQDLLKEKKTDVEVEPAGYLMCLYIPNSTYICGKV